MTGRELVNITSLLTSIPAVGCQSNCNEPDKPSPGAKGDVRNKVIGYYESWRDGGSKCDTMSPEEIPIEQLDQLTLAFVYIDPKDYHIIAMDEGPTASDLFARVANLKTRNPNAKIWVSIGGWAFNDDGPYRSVFTKVAGDSKATQILAHNLMGFMDKYGFDGVDIDWEYPGADDRGGREEDIANYPKMMSILKRYLQGVVDEFNLMAYDLHGRWDREDPIGPYVYAHTNLTEIDQALDLFWRNDIDSSKINLDLAGPCTTTAGILSYSEIQRILSEGNIYPTYDEEAGVYYANYGNGGANWVSFDDTISFNAKIELANKYGLGGVLIWAVDQDDQYYHAMRGVTGKDIEAIPMDRGGFGAFTVDQCYITDCGKSCNPGDITMTKLNDESGRGCGGKNHNARSFSISLSDCCPAGNAPDSSTCHWRGGPVNCHGQCAAGEVSMVFDDYGDTTNGQSAIQDCILADYEKSCPSDKPQEMTSVTDFYYHHTDLSSIAIPQKFCCPAKPAFCCPLPLSNGSAFLPVPLENLFPDADSFSDSYTTTFSEVFDGSQDETSSKVSGTDPNKKAFTWMAMVGEAEDVQSFDKRDGSHLEPFDCPDTHEEDFGVQQAKAVCVGGTDEENNCEDIFHGGVEGTVVRLPAHCGPDAYVRAVRFQRSSNFTLPGHLRKRHPTAYKVYDFHYDYDFHNLRRDGGEVYFHADLSNHPSFWDEIVKADHNSPVKRSAENWRQLDRRYWSESREDWLKRFNALLVKGHTGLEKHYEFNQCLVESRAVCGNGSAEVKASVYGEFNTTMDFGMSLIGRLRNFGFSEAYSYFNQEAFSMRMGAAFTARARMYFDSGWKSIGSFDQFGMNSYIKGIFTVNPYFKMDARLEADAYVSAVATTEMTVSHNRFRAGGGLVFGFRSSIALDLMVQLKDRKYVDTSISLSTPGSIRYDAALSTSCSDGLQFDVTGQLGVDFTITNGLPGWTSKSYDWKTTSPATLFSGCVPFSVMVKRELEGDTVATQLLSRSTPGASIDIPQDSSHTYAFAAEGIYCADPDESGQIGDCGWNSLDLEDETSDTDDEGTLTRRRHHEKRSNTKKLDYCNPLGGKGFAGFTSGNNGTIDFGKYPSGSELVEKYYPDAATYDAEDAKDCNNLNLVKLQHTPQKPTDISANGGRVYDSEHILEAQTVQRFFNLMGQRWSQENNKAPNPNVREYPDPVEGSNKILPWCGYMLKWWQPKRVWSSNLYLGSAFPGEKWHFTEEFVLYERVLNTKIKNSVSKY
ncbi:unnamed protein product [Aspergillus oryzae]|uniref:chitinase n=1 Tax=Aspergillus oryzae TaxID=5062 RepID=A0AAN5C3G1_ASPOZ|nr:unnamed protein product [Aspergillus oryzae]